MPVGLSKSQYELAKTLYSVGKKHGATAKEILAAFETARVEANFSNPSRATDHDSLGWRQERQMYYKNPTNVLASAKRFFQETAKAGRGKGRTAGSLAQAVQRSAFPARYDQHRGEAQRLLAHFSKTGGLTDPAAPDGKKQKGVVKIPGAKETTVINTVTPGVDNSAARRSILWNYLQSRDRPNALLSAALQLRSARDVKPTTDTRKVVQQQPGTTIRLPGQKAGKKNAGGGGGRREGRLPGDVGVVGPTDKVRGRPVKKLRFDGRLTHAVQVDGKWVRPALADRVLWARAHGWKGRVNDALRTKADSARYVAAGMYAAPPGKSNHNINNPGAVDVSDYGTFGALMRRYQKETGRRPLVNRMPSQDPVHYSWNGY